MTRSNKSLIVETIDSLIADYHKGKTAMTMQNSESSPVFYARVAGLLYLTIIICGIYSEVFVRGSLVVMGDAAGTANNILASEGLFRIGFAADILMLLCDVAIAVLFYVLLKPVSRIDRALTVREVLDKGKS